MPARPLGPCQYRGPDAPHGCPRAADSGHGRCAEHARLERHLFDRGRGSAAQRGYGAEWRKIRTAHLALQPFCQAGGCGAPATDVDHSPRYPTLGPDHRLYRLTSYCHRHHSARTSRQVR